MAMHLVRRKKSKGSAAGAALAYKSQPEIRPVAEDTEKAERVFGSGDDGGRYNMILLASIRAYDLIRGDAPMIPDKGHTPIVTAMLEVEAGMLKKGYVKKFSKK